MFKVLIPLVFAVFSLNSTAHAYCENRYQINDDEQKLFQKLAGDLTPSEFHQLIQGIVDCSSARFQSGETIVGKTYTKEFGLIVRKLLAFARLDGWLDRRKAVFDEIIEIGRDLPIVESGWERVIAQLKTLLQLSESGKVNTPSENHGVPATLGEIPNQFLISTFGVEPHWQKEALSWFHFNGYLPDPKTRFRVKNAEFTHGKPFLMESERPGFLYAVHLDGESKPHLRIAWLSSSQGEYRPLLAFDYSRIGPLFNKGFGEESLSLPFAVQKAFAAAVKSVSGELKTVPNTDLQAVVKVLRSPEDFFIRESELKKQFDSVKKFPLDWEIKNKAYFPNWTEISHFIFDSPLYGRTKASAYTSNNGIIDYVIMEELVSGRPWVASATLHHSPLNSFGVPKEFCDPYTLLAPLYEYERLVPVKYFTNKELRYVGKQPYFLNWQAVQENPIIQDWLSLEGFSLVP